MNVALIDARRSRKVDPHTRSTVNFRNMAILAKELGATAIFDTSSINPKAHYDVFVCGFGSMANDFKRTLQLFENNPQARIIWLVGEYEQSHYLAIRKSGRPFEVIKNFDGLGKISPKTMVTKAHTLNLNLLLAREPNNDQSGRLNKKYDCIYYSRWRPGRKPYLKEYLHRPIYFSSDAKNYKHHSAIGCDPVWVKKLSWQPGHETLNLFRYSLYLEDEYTHGVYNHLANRYYEAGFCNNVVLFDGNCINTIKKSELGHYWDSVQNYIVNNRAELQTKIKQCNEDFNYHLAQQKMWRVGEMAMRKEVIDNIRNIVYNDSKR